MSHATLSVVVFVLVMIVIISEKVHRAVVAVGGAVLLIILGVLDIETGVSYIDYNTIGLLIGMMLFVAVVKHSGIFEYLAVKSAKIAKGDPWKMMIVFIIITALLSALLDNVTTVLLVGPMTFAITKAMDLNPVPYIMTQILASNIGGTATLIGDPPNIMIGSATGLSFVDFLVNDGLIVIVVMIATIFAFKLIYKKKLIATPEAMKAVMDMDEKALIKDKSLLTKSVVTDRSRLLPSRCASYGIFHHRADRSGDHDHHRQTECGRYCRRRRMADDHLLYRAVHRSRRYGRNRCDRQSG